ncbi:CGH_3_HP_G0046350.mRNA.1.CDS.1 [Saccharomyces cerevisiae]|nr:CGH_3_HP_G0046350.mRNA.1.CDS.1 [Saccharomyces cerevisiae]CAI4965450.1 CGH_1_HP_G0048180.mRNA.1.CDS.1 [Saccharomyces cerevisiae]CAI4974006.1 CGH_1_HP_G0054130.mRNA.1.CDS.1 [Saccharomyces cerevisiae]CAI5098074.1 CGH_1_HP_G0126860.mRNA.1.CDS.1 [Saccharomyces cerevisiae]CAI5109965.1 CGH_1_HP_G0130990.mRNA.1.CDS.1 [Saccharomyces cerevisiae]
MLAVRRLTRYTFLKRTHPVLYTRRAYKILPSRSTFLRRSLLQTQLHSKMTAHTNIKQHKHCHEDHPIRRSDSAVSIVHLKRAPFKVTVIGSGNWGTTIAKVIAENTELHSHIFEPEVRMWVFDEKIGDENLTDIINTRHQNVKYLPNIDLPHNLVADPDLLHSIKGADILVFNIPHQFLPNIVKQLQGHVAPHVRAISCLKGFELGSKGVQLLSSYVTDELGIQCGALSGANLAPEVAKEHWSETTVAYQLPKDYQGDGKDVDHKILKLLFHRPYFHVNVIDDVAGISIAGALKNVVALACGFVEGMGWGNNASAAIQRLGLGEIVKFGRMFFPESKVETYYQESAGVADLITTCSGGRNVKVATYMAKTGKSALEAEKELLNGQSAQGIITCREVHEWLQTCELTQEFPLFEAVYQIVYNNVRMEDLPEMIEELDIDDE